MAKYKSADEVAKLFAERSITKPGKTVDSDLGTREVWSFWLSVKQVKWLSDQYMRENPKCRWNGRFGGKGEFGFHGETHFWNLRMFPNKAGAIEVARWLETDEADKLFGEGQWEQVPDTDQSLGNPIGWYARRVDGDDTIEVKPEF